MSKKIKMDVHKESITIAVLPGGAKTPARVDRLPNDLVKLKRWLERVATQGSSNETLGRTRGSSSADR